MGHNLLDSSQVHSLELIDWNQFNSYFNNLLHFQFNTSNYELLPQLKSANDILDSFNSIETLKKLDIDLVKNQLASLPQKTSSEYTERLLDKNSLLDIQTIHNITIFLEGSKSLSHILKELSLIDKESLNEGFTLSKTIRKTIDIRGDLILDNEPELKKLQQKIKDDSIKLRSIVKQIIEKPDVHECLAQNTFDTYNDYFILFIRSDRYHYGLGKIIGHSNSGNTLFVLPKETENLQKKLVEQKDIFEKKILHLKQRLSDLLAKNSSLCVRIIYACEKLDILYAKSEFCTHYNLERPNIVENNIEFRDLYHPLIEDPVHNSLSYQLDKQGFIISGPNTGGKTVLLKSICLSFLFMHSGLYVPAKFANMPVFKNIYMHGKDMQNISNSLSSFSSEVSFYNDIFSVLDSSTLLLADEMFSNTSPIESANISFHLLNLLLESSSNSTFFVTTHNDIFLDKVREVKSFLLGSMTFDLKAGQPTYKLKIGETGQSYAFETFIRYFKNSFSKKIEKNLTENKEKNNYYKILLSKIDEYEQKISKVDKEKLSLETKYQDKLVEIEDLKKEFKEIKREYVDKLNHILKNKPSIKSVDKLSESITNVIEKKSPVVVSNAPYNAEEFNKNKRAFSKKYDQKVEVIELLGKNAKILLGKIKTIVPLKDLMSTRQTHIKTQETKVYVDLNTAAQLEIDCRGMKLEEFQDTYYAHIAHIFSETIPYLSIIHGHGDGVLKNWLRNQLKKEKDLTYTIPEGNDGSTEIKLIN